MATGDLIFVSSFQDHRTAAGVLSPQWTDIGANMTAATIGVSPMFGTGGRFDQALLAASNTSGYWRKVFPASYAAGTLGCYFRTGSLGAASLIMAVGDSGTLQHEVRYLATTGQITVTRNGTVLATSTNTLAVDTPAQIEFLFTIHPSAGTYEVKVNGSSTGWIAPATAQNTRNTANSTFNEIRVYSRGTNDVSITNHRFAHLYLVEGLSSVGQYVGHTMRPAGAGYINDFTGNFGSNWLNVSEPDNDGDSSFNQSGTNTDKDAFVLSAAPTGTIKGVQVSLNVRQDTGSGHTIRAFLRISGTNYYGAAQTVTATYQMLTWYWTVNPATSSAWVTADLAPGAIELGYERVS